MNSKKVPNSVKIKTEPDTSTTKHLAQLAAKNVSNARLASFKPPRDLLLTGSTSHSNSTFNINSATKSNKRTFVPNINVTRKKGLNETVQNSSSNDLNEKNKDREKNKKPPPNKKRTVNVVQTKGVFSEGLAPGKIKAFGNLSSEKAYSERQVMDKPKLNLNKKISKSDEDSKLKSILKNEFLDDPNLVPDINFIPNCLPMVYNVKKQENLGDLDKTFEMLQVKTEKVSNVNVNELKNEKSDVTSVFEDNKSPKLFLFEFPSLIQQQDSSEKKKVLSKGQQQSETEKESEKSEGLSSLGEGFLGHLRIHANGKAYLATGTTVIPLCLTRHCTRQEVMSTSLNTELSKGEVISLGTIDASFTCSANFFQDIS